VNPPAMRVVVCVKHVPDATAARGFNADHTVDRAAVDGLLSELDEYVVEQALQITGSLGGEVTVLTMGPEQAGDAIRKSLQMGADRAVHILDDAIHGSDAIATSHILAKALQRLEFDLVICGMASTDGSMGVVPAMLAERLGLPQVTLVADVTVEDGTVRGRRDGDVATETVEASLPAILSVTDQANEPRYPSFKGIMAAKKKPVETWSLADLGVSPDEVGLSAAWSQVASVQARPPREAGVIVADDGAGAGQLVDFLAQRKFL
jgi:electron transfer flavoprotein beta subunit